MRESLAPTFEQKKNRGSDESVLESFTAEQCEIIRSKQRQLAALGYFIGKDFNIPVMLNKPGEGWHWNFKNNEIRVDAKDLMEKPIEYLRFVIAHEGGHRRITRIQEAVSEDEWNQLGFPELVNSIEDPRDNNFIMDAYPALRENVRTAYELDMRLEEELKSKSMEIAHRVPLSTQAGLEYIKLWFKEIQQQPLEISADLPETARAVIEKTLPAAQDAWWRYPTKAEADTGETTVKKYSDVVAGIVRTRIWPEFKKLIDQDRHDQQLQQFHDRRAGADSQDGKEAPGQPKSVDELSESQRQELERALQELAPDERQKIAEQAERVLREAGQLMDQALAGKFETTWEAEGSETWTGAAMGEPDRDAEEKQRGADKKELERTRKKIRELAEQTAGTYQDYRKEVLPAIKELEDELRALFTVRRSKAWKSGFRTGKRISLTRRMQEKAQGKSAVESRAWKRRELPTEKDYAISLLIDLSGSMRHDDKINETFKGAIVLAEVLNRLGIATEINGFNDRLHEFQSFGTSMNDKVREGMENMLGEVHSPRASYNDDGWAVQEASKRLAKQKASERILLVLSDGLPEPSSRHAGDEYDLHRVIGYISSDGNQRIIGLGIGSGTKHVADYYPESVADIRVHELPRQLAAVLRRLIESPR